MLVTTTSNQRFLIGIGDGEELSTTQLVQNLAKMKITWLDAIIIPNYDDSQQNALIEISKNFKNTKIILPDSLSVTTLFGISKNIQDINFQSFENYYITSSLKLSTITYEDTVKAICLKDNNNNEYMFVKGKITEKQSAHLEQYASENLKYLVVKAMTKHTNILTNQNTKIIDQTMMQNNFSFCF
jgi:hypothetical protein